MSNVLLISHEGLASGAKKAIELILGEQSSTYYYELCGETGIDVFKQQLTSIVTTLTQDELPLIIIADLKNGTPYNCALSMIASDNLWHQVQLFSGMNLNLILEVIMAGQDIVNEQTQQDIVESSKNGIFQMNQSEWNKQSSVDEE